MYLQHAPLDLAALIAQVSTPERGALATFVGLVRDHHAGRAVTGLEYSAYGAMAEARCGEIVGRAEHDWPVQVALVHRVGTLEVGDAAVIAVVASAHRAAAFDACRWVIEAVKSEVPIWKREHYGDGSEAWVDPTSSEDVRPLVKP